MKKHELDTPALLVNLAALERNLERMQKLAQGFGVRLRPHTKTHKCPEIARMQVARGAAGITVAKLGEAEVMADAGLDDILIANQVIGAGKIERLLRLAGRVRLAVLVDSRVGVEALDRVFRGSGSSLDVLIEVDTGKARCGLSDLAAIRELAAAVVDAPGLRLRGIETHEGHVAAGAQGREEIRDRARAAGARMAEVAAALREDGHPVDEVSVGSTPAAPYTAAVEGITEMRPGTYVFNDVNQMRIGQAGAADCALSVLATVISRPTAERAVLDAGSKSIWVETARPGFELPEYDGYGWIREAHRARIDRLSEEHAVVELSSADFPQIGEKVAIIPNHVCPVVNLHDELHLLEGDEVVASLRIAARGKVV